MSKQGTIQQKYSAEFKIGVIMDMREHHLNLLNEKLSMVWCDLDRYTIMQMPRKRAIVKVKIKNQSKKFRR